MAIIRLPKHVENPPKEVEFETSLQKHKAIAEKATRFIKRLHNGVIGAFEFSGGWQTDERVDGIVFNSTSSFVVEAKVSRSDFLADMKKDFRANPELGMGDFRYYACPDGLISVDELPEKWGLIYVEDSGKCYLAAGHGDKLRTSRLMPWADKSRRSSLGCDYLHIYHGDRDAAPYHFKRKNDYAEHCCLFFMAKRYREQKFMENML